MMVGVRRCVVDPAARWFPTLGLGLLGGDGPGSQQWPGKRHCRIGEDDGPGPQISQLTHELTVPSSSAGTNQHNQKQKLRLSSKTTRSRVVSSALPFDLSPPPIDHDLIDTVATAGAKVSDDGFFPENLRVFPRNPVGEDARFLLHDPLRVGADRRRSFGYFKKGSTASLAGGAGIGLLLTLAGYISLKAFEKKKNSYPALILETVCAALLTWVMGQRYLHTFKIMPAGVVAGINWTVALFCFVLS